MIGIIFPDLNSPLLIVAAFGQESEEAGNSVKQGEQRNIFCLHCGSSVIKINNDLVTTVARNQPCQHKGNKLHKGMIESTGINDIVLTVNAR